jgi:biotin carboxyl carrier protein
MRLFPSERLLEILLRAESELPAVDDIEVPSRIVHLPLSWEDESAIPAGCIALPSHIPGNVWKILVSPDDTVTEGQSLVILESMKMEVTVAATRAGVIREIRCAEGRPVAAGETLIVLQG